MTKPLNDDWCPVSVAAYEREVEANRLMDAKQRGYLGITPDGVLCDRREDPNAIPIPRTPLFGTPEPREVPGVDMGEAGSVDDSDDSWIQVPFTMFQQTRLTMARVFHQGSPVRNPAEGWQKDLWIERNEDYYALNQNVRTLVVERSDWLKGEAIA